MKKLALMAAICGMVATPVLTQSLPPAPSIMVGTGHDLSSGGPAPYASTNVPNICVFCHTPHQDTAAAGQYPLWNHTLSATVSYGVYTSPTLDAVDVTDLGGAVIGTAAVSNLCLSCHDGTVGVGSLYNDPNTGAPDNAGTMIVGTANLGTDLTDDHPVNFTYDTALSIIDLGLYDPDPLANPQTAALLINGKVQCSSCHDPHDSTYAPFLVTDNTDSALCVHCHKK